MAKNKVFCLALVCVLLICGCNKSRATSEGDTIHATDHATESIATESVQQNYTLEGDGFSSPEEAVMAYLDAMQKGDVNGMLSTFAIETMVDNYDIVSLVKATNGYSSSMTLPLRAEDEYTRSLLILRRQADISNALVRQYYYFNAYDESFYTGPVGFGEGHRYDTPEQFFDDLMSEAWMVTLGSISYENPLTEAELHIVVTSEYWDNIENINRTIESRKTYYGYDDIRPVAIKVYVRGVAYYFFMDVACFDGKWYNFEHGGMMGTFMTDSIAEGFVLAEE